MIDLEQVRKVAHLARLELTAADEAKLPEQLSAILDYVEQLSELNTDEVQPTTRAIDVSNITRADSQKTFGDRQLLLDNAPDREEDYFRVPKILGESE
jgi:aspartyl-tRNA(Asn)/glutamyl-tRNA(Gln) amidotransferase subunit C